jgi:YegS/Rv2252/BmrU family lipid kinase
MPDLRVILNPAAGRGSAEARFEEVFPIFEEFRLKAEVLRTEGPGHATELACELSGRGEKIVVAAGGDGTLNEVAQALVGTETALGILPLGSGNDYARALGIPVDLRKAVEILARGKTKLADVGAAEDRYYLNSLGMGIDGQIAHDYATYRFLRGELGYLLATGVRSPALSAYSHGGGGGGLAIFRPPFGGGGHERPLGRRRILPCSRRKAR